MPTESNGVRQRHQNELLYYRAGFALAECPGILQNPEYNRIIVSGDVRSLPIPPICNRFMAGFDALYLQLMPLLPYLSRVSGMHGPEWCGITFLLRHTLSAIIQYREEARESRGGNPTGDTFIWAESLPACSFHLGRSTMMKSETGFSVAISPNTVSSNHSRLQTYYCWAGSPVSMSVLDAVPWLPSFWDAHQPTVLHPPAQIT